MIAVAHFLPSGGYLNALGTMKVRQFLSPKKKSLSFALLKQYDTIKAILREFPPSPLEVRLGATAPSAMAPVSSSPEQQSSIRNLHPPYLRFSTLGHTGSLDGPPSFPQKELVHEFF